MSQLVYCIKWRELWRRLKFKRVRKNTQFYINKFQVFLFGPPPISYFFKILFIYLFLERGREWKTVGEKYQCVWLPLRRPPLGTWPATQACALIGNWTSNPLIHSPRSIHWATPTRALISDLLNSYLQLISDLLNSYLQQTEWQWPSTPTSQYGPYVSLALRHQKV